jgi:uncharacterized membrane protein
MPQMMRQRADQNIEQIDAMDNLLPRDAMVWLYCVQCLEKLMPFLTRVVHPVDLCASLEASSSITLNPITDADEDQSSETTDTTDNHDGNKLLEHVQCFNQMNCSPDRIFVARRFTNVLGGDIAIFLTFGSIYPPLAVVVFVSILSNTMLTQLSLGRFMVIAREMKNLLPFTEVIKRETAAVGSLIALSIPPVTILAAGFWSFFLFDIIGDEVGFRASIWIIFILPSCVLITRLILFIYYRVIRVRSVKQHTRNMMEQIFPHAHIVRESEMTEIIPPAKENRI